MRGESSCQYAVFALLKAMTLVIYFYDRNHLHSVSLLDWIQLESEHTNTTSVKLSRRPWDVSGSLGGAPTRAVLDSSHLDSHWLHLINLEAIQV